MFDGDCVCALEMNPGDVIKGFTCDIGKTNQHYPMAYSQKGVYFRTYEDEFMLIDSTEDENIGKTPTEMDGSFDCTDLFVFDNNIVERKMVKSTLLAH